MNIGINSCNLAQELLIKSFVILFAEDENQKRPNLHKYKMAATLFANYQIMPHNFLEQIKIEK